MRDLDFCRKALLAIATADDSGVLAIDGDMVTVNDHLALLYEAGLCERLDDPPYSTLTDTGRKFLALADVRDGAIWRAVSHDYHLTGLADAARLGMLLVRMEEADEFHHANR